MPEKKSSDFTHRILSLISEPEFIKVENILSEPNFFKIVGRTHYERWHSAFWGWLLDANGSHLLSDYVLKRFLLLLLDDLSLKSVNHSHETLFNALPLLEFSDIEVAPNEHVSTETSVSGVGRFDIYLTGHYVTDTGIERNLNIVFELKIDSKPDGIQSAKYAEWLISSHPQDDNFLIYLTPKLLDSSKLTAGDDRWYCLDYQLLNDKLLIPLVDHPNLNERVKPFVIQYMKNLKIRYRGIKMAITNEEKRLALASYEKYSDVFDSIYDALVSTRTIDFSTSDVGQSKGRASGKLAISMDGRVFSNETVRLLFEDVLQYLVKEEYIKRLPLPWGINQQRYIVTNEIPPVHPNGRPFFYPVVFDGYAIESHYAGDRAMKVLNDLCDKLEIDFEKIEV